MKSDTSTERRGAKGAGKGGGRGRPPGPGTRKEDWIAEQLRHAYDDALSENIPQRMMDLLRELDDVDPKGNGE